MNNNNQRNNNQSSACITFVQSDTNVSFVKCRYIMTYVTQSNLRRKSSITIQSLIA